MHKPKKPANEAQRLRALRQLDILDSEFEERFDRLTRLCQHCFGIETVLISLVDENRQWFKSCLGLDARETHRDISFCGHAIHSDEILEINDALRDPRFTDNPLVTGPPHIRFYAGAPIHTDDGYRVGTLCIIDSEPQQLTPDDHQKLRDFADAVESELNRANEIKAQAQLVRHHDALVLLNEIASNAPGDLNARVNHALEQARHYLDMDVAILSQIERDVYTVRWVDTSTRADLQAGTQFSLGETWCWRLFSGSASELFIANVPASELHNHPCYQRHPIGSYAAITIDVEGRVFGTLSFSSVSPRAKSFDQTEMIFIRLLAGWLADTLESSLGQERLNKLMAQLPGVVFQYRSYPDGHSTFPFSSPRIQAIYGITPAEAARDARPVFDRIHPDDREAFKSSIDQSAATLENWYITFRVHRHDQAYRWVAGHARPEYLADGSVLWHGHIQDIHEQELARQSLERNETRLRGLFEFSPIGIALNDLDTGQFIELNDALIQPTGYTRDEFVQLNYWDLTPREYLQEEDKALQELESTGRYGPFEKEYIRKDGSRYPVRLQGMLSQDEDGRQVIWSLIEDITERKRIEQMKNEFISTVSHELRTPLTSLAGSLNLVMSGAVGEMTGPIQEMLEIAQSNSYRLKALINDLLDMEKLVSGRMSFHMTSQPLVPIIKQALRDTKAYADQFGVSYHFKEPESQPDVTVDADRLQQVLSNLLSNAAKFSPEGDSVTVVVSNQEQHVRVSVADNGPGIPESFRHGLFQKFSQLDSSDRRKRSGTGLGLAISKELIEQMSGTIDVNSTEGKGSHFYFELPLDNTH